MGEFLDAAYKVLKKENEPLSAIEITDKAFKLNLLISKGKTPHQSMKARLSTDILRKKDKSLFKRTEAGKFALRKWSEVEYVAPRHKTSIIDEDIAVFKKSDLPDFVDGSGIFYKDIDYISNHFNRICFPHRRKEAENDESLIQLVSVFITRYKNKYLTFKRSKWLPENRLHGFYSISFGGHVTSKELAPLLNIFDPNYDGIFIIKELSEELRLEHPPEIKYRGLIYDDSREVSKIHLGLIYDVSLMDDKYEIGERGFLIDPKFEDIETINNRRDEFENWSQLIIKEELKRK
jgi:predicted NUDIX family phosphoesterase